ncbi:MAG: ATP-binding protein [Candidatus Woesearchaeota archaeon]
MKVLNQKKINITPHKSIYRKMGRSSHGFNESIAELVDNSIDAMTNEQKEGKEKLEVKIFIDSNKHQIIVMDNAKGMNEEEAAKAIVLAESSKGKDELGEYGFGLKTAALSIGKRFHVITGQKGETKGYHFVYDEDEWENNPELTWNSFPFNEIEKPKDEHGTNIKIERLKIKLNPIRVTSLKNDLGKRYRAYINRHVLEIQVNTKLCKPEKINWSDGYPKSFEIETKFGKIHGIIGLMKEGSQKGLYGFDLFRKGRMIRTYEKFAIPEHPTSARIMGEIHLDFVPITHEKNRFIEESDEYEEAERACKESDIFKEIVKEARKKATKETITQQVQERTNLWQDYLARAFKDPDLKSIINPNIKTKEEKPQEKDEGDEQKEEAGKLSKFEVEKRNDREEPKKQEQKEPESERERIPKETHEALRHTVTIFGKTFKFKHDWIYDSGLGRKDYKIDEKEGIIIFTNTAFPAFLATSDQPFYAAMNIVEAIAEVYAKESGFGIEKMNEAKDLALRKASELKNQLEEEKIQKEKQQKRKNCELCGAEIDFKSPLTKFCAECSKNRLKDIQRKYYSSPEFKEKMKRRKNESRVKIFKEYLEQIRSGENK